MVIAKYLAACGLGSRRACEPLIKDGRVSVNGETITDLAIRIDPVVDEVAFDGKTVKQRELVYYLLNKPVGYTCSRSDTHADKLVTELVPGNPPVWPVGRLDRETTGLIILTNDGDLTQALTHPSRLKRKEYILQTDRPLSAEQVLQAQTRVILEDGPLSPDELEVLETGRYRIAIHEGRKRIIRRLAAFFGRRVVSLERTAVDTLRLSDLKPGRYRELTGTEVATLKGER